MKILKFSVAGMYVLMLVYIVFLSPERMHRTIPESTRIRWIPVKSTVENFTYLMRSPVLKGLWNFFMNLFGNVVLFIPLSFILILICRISGTKVIVLAALLLSVAIEVIQYTFSLGVADIDDVILNAAGAFIGIHLCRYFIRSSLSVE